MVFVVDVRACVYACVNVSVSALAYVRACVLVYVCDIYNESFQFSFQTCSK